MPMRGASVIERIRGVRIETGANRPFPLDDAERVYFVERGHLDVFIVESSAGDVVGRRRFVARVRQGEMAFGATPLALDRPDLSMNFLAVPSQDAVIVAGRRVGAREELFDPSALSWIDEWVAHLSEFLARDLPPLTGALLLEADPDVPCSAGSTLTAQHRDVIWVSTDRPVRFLGRDELTIREGDLLLPVTERTWLELDQDAEVSASYTPTAHVFGRLWPAFDRFSELVLEFALYSGIEDTVDLQARRRAAWDARRASVNSALDSFGGILGAADDADDADAADAAGRTALERASSMVAEACGAQLDIDAAREGGAAPTVESLARASRIHTRRVRLAPGWWKKAGPSMLGFTAAEGAEGEREPLALISDDGGHYRAVNPLSGEGFDVDERTARRIARDGVVFHARLRDRIASVGEILRFALHGRAGDVRVVLALGLLGGLAGLLPPILTGQILVEIIPRRDFPLAVVTFGALLMVALGSIAFEVVRGLAALRIESRVDERLQTAVWSRLVSLPTRFFRRFTAGDLANRAVGIAAARQALTGALVQAGMGLIISTFSLGLLFYFSGSLALLVTAMLLFMTGLNWFVSWRQLRHYREVHRVQGELSGFVFQLITGLAKLRVANAENHVLANWARRYATQKKENLAALHWAAGQQVLGAAFQPLSLIVIFATIYHVVWGDGSSFDLFAFLCFNAAFGQLTAGVNSLTGAASAVIGVLPLIERARPILDTEPEASEGIDPGELKGDIEFENVRFRYSDDSPNAVDGVSFGIRQGDYVAFVGPSGSGKSTIYRLLLGFETPDSGTVFLDGHNLASLDLARVRGRLGVVLQHGQIVAGSIYENIAGMSPLSSEDAWAAARGAALEDDIRAMPMGMRTMLPEGGAGLSVGQKQRLLIARALARKPRVLLFDEATSALDNRAQARVQDSLRQLGVTRLVIAHRLSSIRDVDRIFVMQEGRIVERGTYEELIGREGVFATLSRRQLVEV